LAIIRGDLADIKNDSSTEDFLDALTTWYNEGENKESWFEAQPRCFPIHNETQERRTASDMLEYHSASEKTQLLPTPILANEQLEGDIGSTTSFGGSC
jgi:hypothetical protein